MTNNKQIAVFGGGCFWCTEAVFSMLKGVTNVLPGYAGGMLDNPTYEQVCSGTTGHAEVISMEYDPTDVKYEDLLTVFFASHDSSTPNRQGNDIGTQYRSVVFYTTPEQKEKVEKFIKEFNESTPEGKPAVTEVAPLTTFFKAENYHKDYYSNHPENPYCEVIINPKVEKIQQKFSDLLKANNKKLYE